MEENLWEEGDKLRVKQAQAEELVQKAVVKSVLLRKRARVLDKLIEVYQKGDVAGAKIWGEYSLTLKEELDKLE